MSFNLRCLLSLCLVVLGACHVRGRREPSDRGPGVTADLEVGWTIDGAKDGASCAVAGVASFLVRVSGPDVDEARLTCGERWGSGESFYELTVGDYEVSVLAKDTAGATLAEVGRKVVVGYDPSTIWTVDVNFDTRELAPAEPGSAALELRWNINGTVDGSATGDSWDSCAEVGAAKVAVELDGEALETLPCGASVKSMRAALDGLEGGARRVSLALLDEAGEPLTTAAAGELGLVAGESSRFVADFYFDAFFEPKKTGVTGDYRFRVTLDGKGCVDVGAAGLAASLEREPAPISPTPLVCEEGASSGQGCFVADGTTLGACLPGASAGRVAGLTWGLYRLSLAAPAAEGDACWQPEGKGAPWVEILVGAGAENPVVTHRLARRAGCAP